MLMVFLLLPVSKDLSAQTTTAGSGENLICDPIPEDIDLLSACNLQEGTTTEETVYGPGEDPANPIVLPASGSGGSAGAYGSVDNSMLIVSTNVVAGVASVLGMTLDPITLQLKTGPFKINQGTAYAGTPRVAYSPESNKYLVAWEDSRGGTNTRQTYARFVQPDGTMPGSDFQVMSQTTFFNDLEYDQLNKKFVFLFEDAGKNSFIKTVDASGTVSDSLKVPRLISEGYEGQGRLAINTNLNQYWVAMMPCLAPDGATSEDCKATLYRIDISTGVLKGEALVLSQPNIGQNKFGGIDIAYSPVDKQAVVMWLERGRPEGLGQWGRSVSDDGALTNEYEVISPYSFPFTSGFGAPHLTYNLWTNSFFDITEDFEGGSILIETTSSGVILNISQSIAPPVAFEDSSWKKFVKLFIHEARAAFGTFNPSVFATPTGAISMGSYGYTNLVITSTQSVYGVDYTPTPGGTGGGVPTKADTTTLPKLINQIYTWALGISALLALLMTVLGGYYYMTSGGNAEQASKGTEMIWGAIIGLVLLFGSYLILRTINPDLVNFKIDSVDQLNAPPASTP